MNQYDQLKNKLHNYKVEIDKDKLWKNTFHAIPQRKKRRAVLLLLFAGLVISGWLLHSSSSLPLSESSSSPNGAQISNHHDLPQNQPGSDHISKSTTGSENKFLTDTKEQNEILQTVAWTTTGMQNNNSFPMVNELEKENIDRLKVQVVESVIPEESEGSFVIIHQSENDITNADHVVNGPVDYLFKAVSQITMTKNSVAVAGSLRPEIRPLKDKFLQSFQMVQGVGFSTVKIHSLTPEGDQLASKLEQKMRSLETLSTSATATISLPERFSLESGLQLTRLTTVIDHEWETSERIQQEGVTTIIIDENGIPQSIAGNKDVTRITHYHAKRFTEHRQVDVVFALHRRFWTAQRLSLNAFIKAAYNLSYQTNGTILSENDELIGFSKDDNPFRQKSPVAIGGGIQMSYRLNPHLNLSGKLTFDQYRYKFKDSTIPVRFQHSGLLLGLGIGYVF